MHAVLDRVTEMAERGFTPVPVYGVGPDGVTCTCPSGANCKKQGKHAIGDGWNESKSLEEIEDLSRRQPRMNLGVLVQDSGLVVIDIDPRNGGKETMQALVAAHGPLPRTRVVSTGSDGWHYYFKAPEGVELRGYLGGSDGGVDLKHNGFVVAEGSTSATGSYTLLTDAPIADLPQWIIDEARRPEPAVNGAVTKMEVDESDPDLPRQRSYLESGIKREIARLDGMAKAKTARIEDYKGDDWDNTTLAVSCNLIEFANTPQSGLTMEEAEGLVFDHAPRDEGFTDHDVRRILDSAHRKVGDKARTIPAPRVDPFSSAAVSGAAGSGEEEGELPDDVGDGVGERHSGQIRMAYRLAEMYGGRLMHVYGIGWMAWTGSHWEEDKKGKAKKAVVDVLEKAIVEALGDKELLKDVVKCSSASGINGVLSIAEALEVFAATADDLNTDPWLVNTRSGTYDLQRDVLLPHDPNDRITMVTDAPYDPEAYSPEWETFLERILPDADERGYLQRLLGHAMVGRVTEHLFPVMRGEGRNGKGTLYEAVSFALGNYAIAVDPSMLMATDSDRSQGPEMLRLMGARLAFASETRDGRSLDEAVMKRLTGGDIMVARNLYKPPVEWHPSHQIVYVTNHLPQVKGDDPAVWARIRVIPFDVQIPVEERDPDLGRRLESEGAAILAWVIQGYRDYAANGMNEPDSVKVATLDYQRESDAFSRFIEEACLSAPAASATSREIFNAYGAWARAESAEQISEKALVGRLTKAGYQSKRTSRGKVWTGISPYVTQEEGQ